MDVKYTGTDHEKHSRHCKRQLQGVRIYMQPQPEFLYSLNPSSVREFHLAVCTSQSTDKNSDNNKNDRQQIIHD